MPPRHPSSKGWLAHYREFFRLGQRSGRDREDAEDAMHDTVLRILEHGALAAQDPRAYLKRSVGNGLIDRLRRRSALPMLPLHELDEADHPMCGGVDAEVGARQMARDLMAALEELPWACQQVYVRHRLEGWTHAEIAEFLGVSRAMVEKHMTRALRHLNRKLQKYAP